MGPECPAPRTKRYPMRTELKREDFEKGSVYLAKGNGFGKPDVSRMEWGDHSLMVKDVWRKNFFSRWTFGLWLIHKEWKIYSHLSGIKGIPQKVERIDRFAFATEFIPAQPIGRGQSLSPSFFSRLEQILTEIHSRGVVHLDLRHKGNILLSEEGEPFLIDFNSSLFFKKRGLVYRFLFPLLRWVDYGGLLKLKQRVSPSWMTSEELAFLRRFNRIRKWWIFN